MAARVLTNSDFSVWIFCDDNLNNQIFYVSGMVSWVIEFVYHSVIMKFYMIVLLEYITV